MIPGSGNYLVDQEEEQTTETYRITDDLELAHHTVECVNDYNYSPETIANMWDTFTKQGYIEVR